MAEHKVIVYSTEWCPWCSKAKEWLAKNSVKFENRDVEKNAEYAEEMQNKSHQTSIPVIDIDGKIIIGYNEQAMKQALGL
ncbi:MAG TPA: glutaredoxin family protein [Candidatus Bilamarchaeaceae archaeon]|nr:glutaredoxin family protein [Candidatus Bilamarchaeaceae archaeon]